MKCPKCSTSDTKVVESRDVAGGNSVRRRRQCLKCDNRFTTYERLEQPNLVVIKRDGSRELFDSEKLLQGINKAAEKTSITAVQRHEIVDNVLRELFESGESEVSSSIIGELVVAELAQRDEVAYVRFASVYRHFTSIEGFERELSKMRERSRQKT